VQKANTERLAKALLEQETLTHEEVMALLDQGETGTAQRASTSTGCSPLKV
jgi:ATP-dependent Zn protease